MILEVPSLPEPGQTVIGNAFKTLPGGKGANQAVASARLGAETTFVAAIGNDSFGEATLTRLRDEGINTDHIVRKDNIHSGIALIYVDSKGENMIAVSPGANGLLTPEDVLNAEEAINNSSMMILQLEIPIETAVISSELAKKHGCSVLLNPAPITSSGVPDELLANTDIITPNQGELMLISGNAGSIEEAAKSLLQKGPKAVIVTMGKNGAAVFTMDDCCSIPAIKVDAIDTVGAGDCFTAALGVSIADGVPLKKAVKFAVTASGLSTLVSGAQEGMPSFDAVKDRMRDEC